MNLWPTHLKKLIPHGQSGGTILDRLGGRILVYAGITFLVGWLGLSILISRIHEQLVMSQNERSVLLVTRSVANGLRTIMLAGDAVIAEDFSKNLQGVSGMVEFRILRNDGTEAFRTNDTIRLVNSRLGGDRFSLHKRETRSQILPKDSEALQKVLTTGQESPFYSQDPVTGAPLLTYVAPIPSQEECRACHGQGDAVRGVIKLTMSLAKAREEVEQARWWIFGFGTLVTGLVMILIHLVVRRFAVAPLERMAAILTAEPASADLEDRFIPVRGCVEFRQVATAFNRMTTRLNDIWSGLKEERDKLTTIVLSAREGIVVTDRHEQVALVNPAAERLLGKSTQQIRSEGFLQLFDDPEHLRALREDHARELPGLAWFNNRMLQAHAATIRDGNGEVIGSAALIRDVTREKALEDELRKLSNTDGLTGLFNRRRFDAALLEEHDRAKRYGLILGLLLFDVDHFKRFNDTHGHDQGDRVLQGIAEVMRGHFRSVDYPCRYGGEEFCVIMPSTGAAGVTRSAERLRQSVESMRVDNLQVTVSIGVAIFPGAGREGPDAMLKAADLALYTAKRRGRNQICQFTPQMETPPAE
ncbi:MAG: diguanylate cyclase [Magnetococcales bacterium]|nr:diguanylate cyclase [Magnetococcales bacterium]